MRTFQISKRSTTAKTPLPLDDGATNTEHLILAGTEYLDHAIWLIRGGSASLVGVLKEDGYKKLRRTRNLDLQCTDDQFDFVGLGHKDVHMIGRLADFAHSAAVYKQDANQNEQ
jgi:hypothetical protein